MSNRTTVELSNWDARVEGEQIQFELTFRLPQDQCKSILMSDQDNNKPNTFCSVGTSTTPPPKTFIPDPTLTSVCTPKGGDDYLTRARIVEHCDDISQYGIGSPKKPLKNPNRRHSVAAHPVEYSPDDPDDSFRRRQRSRSSSPRVSPFTHSTFHLTQQTPLSGGTGPDGENEPVVLLWDSVRKHGQTQNFEKNINDRSYFLTDNSQSPCREHQLCSPGSAGQGGEKTVHDQADEEDYDEPLVDKGTNTGDNTKPVTLSAASTQKISYVSASVKARTWYSYKPEPVRGMVIWTNPRYPTDNMDFFSWTPPEPFVDYWTAIKTMLEPTDDISKHWDAHHFPPLGCHELAVILEDGASSKPNMTICARRGTGSWKLSARYAVREADLMKAFRYTDYSTLESRACLVMRNWLICSGWWLHSPHSAKLTIIHLDLGCSPHGMIGDHKSFYQDITGNTYKPLQFKFTNFPRIRAYLDVANEQLTD